MALHAVAYCERLFYLEEVEEISIADERVLAGASCMKPYRMISLGYASHFGLGLFAAES